MSNEEKFRKFAEEFDLSQDNFEKLLEAKITSVRKLAWCSPKKFSEIVDDPFFCEAIHLLLYNNAKKIARAKDPYEYARNVIHDSDDETDTGKDNHGKSSQVNVNASGSSFLGNAIGQDLNVHNDMDSLKKVMRKIEGVKSPIARKMPEKSIATAINIKGVPFSTSDLQFVDNKEFSMSDFQLCEDGFFQNRSKDTKYYYPTYTKKSNRAIIINNVDFSLENNEDDMTRYGADKDEKNMEDVLKKLGFQVKTVKNKKISEIKQFLLEFASSPENDKTSATVVFIGSHGREKDKQTCFIGTEGEYMSAEDVCEYFFADQCPKLVGKPKIFFFQCCRSDVQSDSVETNSSVNMDFLPSVASDGDVHESHNKADILMSFATAVGTKAYRHDIEGSWFVNALCKVLAKKAAKHDLLSMMTMVNNEVMAKKGELNGQVVVQMAESKNTFSKKVQFYPH